MRGGGAFSHSFSVCMFIRRGKLSGGTAGKLAARKQRVAQAFENCESSVIILLIYTVQYIQYFVDMYSVT
jgi:hypothetical protein